jgi:hypothetical protein
MSQKLNNTLKFFVLVFFAFFAAWWVYITYVIESADPSSFHNQAFGATYGIVSLVGGVIGLIASSRWGGIKSLIGRALVFFSLGLLAQEVGQLTYSYYTHVLHVEIPYPSWGDLGYFSSIFFYIYAAWQLAKVAGVKFSLKDTGKKVIATVLPLALLVTSYMYFLKGYQFDFSHPLTMLLDLGYPLGQTVYIIIALMTYLLSKKLLGGIMRNKVLFILVALLVQYVADFAFLNAAKNQTAYPGGANDLMYLIAYAVMALALNSFTYNATATSKVSAEKVGGGA